NHRHFHERIDQEIARASRFGTTFSLVLLDLDLFKSYNDIYGHLAGDQLLNKIGYLLQSAVRGIDMAFRYGGEEFALILPETPIDNAYQVAERIRKSIEANSSFREMPVTASFGIGSWPNDGIMKEEIIRHADAALYYSKQTGRNRTSLYSDVLKPGTKTIDTELESQPKSLSVIYALAATVDIKDNYTYGHSRKVSEYAVALAEKLRLPKEKIETIRAAGLLHDIGKIGVPDSILSKPETLNDDEWEMVKKHPELGVEILKRVEELVSCLPPILHHHEYFNGSGYPQGLSGNNIPLEARILSIADAYDAITSPRPYRKQLSMVEAIEELTRCSDSQFDPELVKLFTEVVEPLIKNGKRLSPDSDSKKE
ncbi:MAG: diguanylate cyclase, partial [Chloroflexi bacterium]|nr:diguanylate cyclase [Chloroflexota bacterium]